MGWSLVTKVACGRLSDPAGRKIAGRSGSSIPSDLLKREYIAIVELMSLSTVMTGHDRLARL
jgi:hypothetical protein